MKRKKTFCFILPAFSGKPEDPKGGSEIQVFLLAQELLKRGWEVHYIRENFTDESQEETVNGIVLHSLPPRHTKLKWLNKRHLLKLMKSIQADVWYCRATVSYVYPVWKNAQKTGGHVVWACSSDRHLSKNPVPELKKESPLRLLAGSVDNFLFRKALKRIDLILLQSLGQKEILQKNWRLQGEVIYNSFPLPSIVDKKRSPLILWIGRLKHIKHPEKFWELVQRFEDKPCHFKMIGREAGNLRFTQELTQMEKSYSRFSYLGEVERDKVFSLLKQAKILVNTSDYEGFPNTFIEAWLHGVPVISLNVDPDGLIQKNKLGSVSHTMEKMARDVERLMENQKVWEETSRRCLEFARKNFNIKDKVDQLEFHLTPNE